MDSKSYGAKKSVLGFTLTKLKTPVWPMSAIIGFGGLKSEPLTALAVWAWGSQKSRTVWQFKGVCAAKLQPSSSLGG